MAKLYLGTQEVSDALRVINIQELDITPTISAQTITAIAGTGYSPVNVSAVTSAIDSNITAGNIKKDVTILGVTGTYEVPAPRIGIPRGVSAQGKLQMPTSSFTFTLPNSATYIGTYAMYYAFYNCTGLTSVDLSNLTTISGDYGMYYAFQNCTSLESVDLSTLTTISGSYAMYYAFQNCTGLTSVDLSSLTTISGSYAIYSIFQNCTSLNSVDLSSLTTINGSSAMQWAFQGCTGLTSVDLSGLTTISGTRAMQYAFRSCTSLVSVDLSSLTTVSAGYVLQQAFSNCTSLKTLAFPSLTSTSFGSYTNQFNNMLQDCTGVTVHFPSNLQSVIGSWSDVTGGFGGTNTTVLYDLPATT